MRRSPDSRAARLGRLRAFPRRGSGPTRALEGVPPAGGCVPSGTGRRSPGSATDSALNAPMVLR
jgi:hypothetical protein